MSKEADAVFDAAAAIAREVVDERSLGSKLSEIQQRAMHERVPTHRDAFFEDIINGQRRAMDQTASEFVAPYLQRIEDKTREHMAAQSALDNERQAHRQTISRLGTATDRIAKLEAENKAVRDALQKLESEVADARTILAQYRAEREPQPDELEFQRLDAHRRNSLSHEDRLAGTCAKIHVARGNQKMNRLQARSLGLFLLAASNDTGAS